MTVAMVVTMVCGCSSHYAVGDQPFDVMEARSGVIVRDVLAKITLENAMMPVT